MTDEDKRVQKGLLLVEYQEAEDTLAHLREKAKRLAGILGEISSWIVNSQGYGPIHPPQEHPTKEFLDTTSKINSDPKYEMAMNYNQAYALVRELGDAHEKLADLKKRKAALGLR